MPKWLLGGPPGPMRRQWSVQPPPRRLRRPSRTSAWLARIRNSISVTSAPPANPCSVIPTVALTAANSITYSQGGFHGGQDQHKTSAARSHKGGQEDPA